MVGRGFGVLLLAAIALSAAPAAAQTASKCTAQKYKAVGKYAQALAGCRARTLAKGLPADSLCGAKALLKLQIAFEKAERKGDCLGTRDDSFAAGETEGYFETLTPVLESTLSCCSFGGLGDACGWFEDPDFCAVSLGGTLGAPGSVCDGATGDCIAPPVSDGACCSFEGDISCQGGVFSIGSCQINSGTFFESALCTPARTCEVP